MHGDTEQGNCAKRTWVLNAAACCTLHFVLKLERWWLPTLKHPQSNSPRAQASEFCVLGGLVLWPQISQRQRHSVTPSRNAHFRGSRDQGVTLWNVSGTQRLMNPSTVLWASTLLTIPHHICRYLDGRLTRGRPSAVGPKPVSPAVRPPHPSHRHRHRLLGKRWKHWLMKQGAG